MVRTGMLEEIRVMRFEEIHDRFYGGSLSASEAAAWLGVSERTFRRWRRFDSKTRTVASIYQHRRDYTNVYTNKFLRLAAI